jgi:cytochrome P450
MAFLEYATRLGAERAERPGDDLSSQLMRAEVDGEHITPFEFAAFVVLLALAGNETTRNAISWGMYLQDAARFDIQRENAIEMVGFGGGGGHFCLGANLARREIQVMLGEIFKSLPDLEITGPPDRLQSNFINGIKRMPCEFSVR